MMITDVIKSYNVYDCAGCADTDTLEEWGEKIVSWINSDFGKYLEAKMELSTITTSKYPVCYIYAYFKNTSVGIYFTISQNTSNIDSYITVGYVYGDNIMVTQKEQIGITPGNKTLSLFVICSAENMFLVPGNSILKNYMCAFCKVMDESTIGILYTAEDILYVSCGNEYTKITYALGKRSGFSKKLLVPFAVPTMNYLFRDILKSDGMVVENYAVYQIDERYFVDLPVNDTNQCLTFELFEEV